MNNKLEILYSFKKSWEGKKYNIELVTDNGGEDYYLTTSESLFYPKDESENGLAVVPMKKEELKVFYEILGEILN